MKMMRFVAALGALCMCALVGAERAAAQQPIFTTFEYAVVDGRSLKLDYYWPNASTPWAPTIVWIHAGSWSFGSRQWAWDDARILQSRGYAVAAIEFRFSQEAVWPAQMHDAKGAVRWLRANRRALRIDPTRMGVWGDSSGGHMAAVLATSGGVAELEGETGGNLDQSSAVHACVDFYGPTDFLIMTGHRLLPDSSVSRLIGRALGDIIANRDNPEWAPWVHSCNLANPSFHITPDDPPVKIFHSPADTVVLINQSEVFHAALQVGGVPSNFTIIPNINHYRYTPEALQAIAFFEQVIPPRPPPCVDWDLSGEIGLSDISYVLNGWGQTVEPFFPGDGSGDGLVDLEDLSVVIRNWGLGCGN